MELVFAAFVTGLFGVLFEVLRRFWRDNKVEHGVVVERLDVLRGEVGGVKLEVSGLRRDHERLVDRFDRLVDETD